MQKLTKKTLSHRHVNIWNQITTSQKYMQTATCTTLKKTSLLPTPGRPAEICAQKQCLHFFTILLTAICDRGWCLRLNASQNRDWCKKSRKSKKTSVVCGKCLKPLSEKHSQNLTGIFWTSARFPWWHPDEWTHVPEAVMKHPGSIGIWAVELSALVASEFSPIPGAFTGSSGSYTYDST